MQTMSEIRAWATVNVGELQRRPGGSLRHKLRQRGPQPEPRYYNWLRDHEAQIEEMTALAEAFCDIDEILKGECVAAGSDGRAATTAATSEAALVTTSPGTDVTTNARSSRSQPTHPDAPPEKKLAITDPHIHGRCGSRWLQHRRARTEEAQVRRDSATGTQDLAASSWAYFEAEEGAWCGMHALNNYYGGHYVAQQDCRSAARQVVARLGRADTVEDHLDSVTGFLSIDVINIIGAALLNIHVEGNEISWANLRAVQDGAALVNWNNKHWTVLQRDPSHSNIWRHTNSIVGDMSDDLKGLFQKCCTKEHVEPPGRFHVHVTHQHAIIII